MKYNIVILKENITKLLVFSCTIELVFYFSFDVLAIILFISISWFFSYKFVFTKQNVKYYPLPTFLLIGYTFFYIILPIPATLIELKPVNFNLKNSLDTFFHILALNVCLTSTFGLYKRVILNNKLRSILKNTQFFRVLSNREVIVLSILGLTISSLDILIYGKWHNEEVVIKKHFVFEMFGFFKAFTVASSSLILPYFKLNKSKSKSSIWIVISISTIIFFVGIAANVRTTSISYIIHIFICAFFLYLLDKPSIKVRAWLIAVVLIGIVLFEDISRAIVISRSEKTNMSGIEMLSKTLDVYNNKELLDKYKKMNENKNLISANTWDERYIDNSLLSRFCSVKTIDETIYYSKKIGFNNEKMLNNYSLQILMILPARICYFLGISESERKKITGYSETDYLYSLAVNDVSRLGNFKIGSIQGLGLAMFGYWYLIIVSFLFFIIFFLLDSTTDIVKGEVVFSLWAFINLFFVFYLTSPGHNFHTELRYIIRGFFESIFFYLVGLYISEKFIKMK